MYQALTSTRWDLPGKHVSFSAAVRSVVFDKFDSDESSAPFEPTSIIRKCDIPGCRVQCFVGDADF